MVELIGEACDGTSMVSVRIPKDLALERGMLLAGDVDEDGLIARLATSADVEKVPLFVAYEDQPAGATEANVYSGGYFNRTAIKLTPGLDVESFRASMRKQSLYMTEVGSDV